MKIILGAIKEFNDDALLMAKQLGSEGFHFNTPPIATEDEDFWTVRALTWLREYTEKFGLKLEMIENVPVRFFDKIMLGTEGRDQQIENYIKTLHNMGKVGIPILGHHFCPTWAWRTSITAPPVAAQPVPPSIMSRRKPASMPTPSAQSTWWI